MSIKEPRKVTGQACLEWLDKDVGFVDKFLPTGISHQADFGDAYTMTNFHIYPDVHDWVYGLGYAWEDSTAISKFPNDKTKRIVGWVKHKCNDGGLEVAVLGNQHCTVNDCVNNYHLLAILGHASYVRENPLSQNMLKDRATHISAVNIDMRTPPILYAPNDNITRGMLSDGGSMCTLSEMIEFRIDPNTPSATGGARDTFYDQNGNGMLTNDPDTTLIYGKRTVFSNPTYMRGEQMGDPLAYLQGDMYSLCNALAQDAYNMCPGSITETELPLYDFRFGSDIEDGNCVAIPYNMILTSSREYALAYLNNGVLPPDAFLYPLDWENLPVFEVDDAPDDDTDDGDDDDNKPGFTGEPDPPIRPTQGPASLTNNNYYWLSAFELESFINWFWNDVGAMSDFDDIINKVMGLYNDLASTVLMVRYMPVDISWIGGNGTPGNIITGMIEKAGNVATIAKNMPPIIDVGHVRVPKEYNSFASYSPYSDCMLYLPYYGFMDIDMDMFTGHDIYVKAIYDHISGTIQYLIYYENEFLVNSVVCKMAVDIPITLQSKNDRDSAIFNNVSNAVAGLLSAGGSVATGNPIGLVLGAQTLTSGVQSAPLTVRGTIGESGAFYAPSKCKLITQFPVEQKASKFSQFAGKQLNKTMSLSNSDLFGLTTCYNPRITFNNSTPLQEEVDKIYQYLEEGVIL